MITNWHQLNISNIRWACKRCVPRDKPVCYIIGNKMKKIALATAFAMAATSAFAGNQRKHQLLLHQKQQHHPHLVGLFRCYYCLQSLRPRTRTNLFFQTNVDWPRCSRAAIYIFSIWHPYPRPANSAPRRNGRTWTAFPSQTSVIKLMTPQSSGRCRFNPLPNVSPFWGATDRENPHYHDWFADLIAPIRG